MIETLDILKGEGDIRTITEKRVRRECVDCGEPAHFKLTFLRPNARNNPASSAYRHDDCSWCEDACLYACREHAEAVRRDPPEGYEWCAQFPAIEGREHLFLHWVKV